MSHTQQANEHLIDTSFAVEQANQLAHLESYNKHYYRPNTYLHKWWARRCGTTFRLILKHLVEDPQRRDYYAPGGMQGRIILDPMIGGGTSLHEALRMGANVIGVDIDPIPILQARATLTDYPFSRLQTAFNDMYRTLRQEFSRYYQTSCPICDRETEFWYMLYGARRHCACGPVLVVDSLVLRQESDGTSLRLCPYCRRLSHSEEPCSCGESGEVQIVERGTDCCPACGELYVEDMTASYYTRFQPLAVSGHCPEHRLFFREPSEAQEMAGADADRRRTQSGLDAAQFAVEPGGKSIQLSRRGIDNYLDLFSSRQILVLEAAIARLPNYAEEERLTLALLLSTSLEFNSMLCGYKGRGKRRSGAIRHTFAHHAYTFPLTAVENNPLYRRRASGTWQKLFHMRVRRARQWAAAPRERDLSSEKAEFVTIPGEVDSGVEVADYAGLEVGERRFMLRQGSATSLDLPDDSVDFIVTDPPYYDSVQYSDLAAFFRVWLRRMLPEASDWRYDVGESAVDPHKNGRDSRYLELMSGIFQESARVLRPAHGRLIFTFHHWNPKGWSDLAVALKAAGFHLLNYAVVHAEHPISVHIANMNALTHDAVLVLALKGTAGARSWTRPLEVEKSSSASFCAGCAELLGWTLNAGLTPDEIAACWQDALA